MGLAEHGEWAQSTGGSKGPRKINEALEALGDDDRDVLMSWLHDPSWPANRVARACRRMGQAEAIPEMAAVNHNNVSSWRASNGVRADPTDGPG